MRRQTAALNGWRIRLVTTTLAIISAVVLAGCTSERPSVAPLPAVDVSVPGTYEFEVGNSVYPLSRGAFKGFQRYLNSGEQVRSSLEWKEGYAIRYKWSLTVYAPDDRPVLNWNGTDLRYNFGFVAAMAGTYKIEIIKRDSPSRGAQFTIDPPDWDRWGR